MIYTKHAKERMASRKFSPLMVYMTLNEPDSIKEGYEPNTKKFTKRMSDGHELTVVAARDYAAADWIVVTVFVKGKDD